LFRRLTVVWTGSGLTGLAFVATAGMIVYGSTLAIAFSSGAWLSGARAKASMKG
jgi:hypothetical protein